MTIDNRQQLLGTINSQIKLNGVGAITGPILNNILDTTVNSVMFYAGVWSQYTNYSPLDVVLYNGVSYIALLTNVNLSPSANPTYWTPLVTASRTLLAQQDRFNTTTALAGSLVRLTSLMTEPI